VEATGFTEADFPDDAWDRQMKADAKTGAFDDLISEALDDHQEGRSTPLP